ncbi:putative metabolite transport protein [Yarrowia sp. B02]|nr:putative metabolite transport protein [Yarrowia sp. B02]
MAASTSSSIPDNVEKQTSADDYVVHTPAEENPEFVVDDIKRNRRQRIADAFTVLAAGFALISDGYQNSLMTMMNVTFKERYGAHVYNSTVSTRVSNALLVGEVIGMVVIGLTCDYMGRKTAIVITTILIVIGGIMAAASHGKTTDGMFWMLVVSRGVIGFGSGGEYPAASTSASEAANETHLRKKRGAIFVLCTNLPLSFGNPFCVIVFLIVYAACGFKGQHLSTVWRTCMGIGCIWPLSVFYFRLKMAQPRLYTKSAIKKAVPYWLILKFYWRTIIGTAGTWFIYDFVVFPNGVFSGSIIATIIKPDEPDKLLKTAEWQLLIGAIGLPGVFVGAYLCENRVLGRKYTMLIGFALWIVVGLVIGCAYTPLKRSTGAFVFMYGMLSSSGNLGPGNMLGLISSEAYATAVRGTLYGFSAAVGKAGAAVGTQVFKPIQGNLGDRWTFIIAAILGLCGVIVTLFFVPRLNGEDLEFEDVRFKQYLRAHGWEGDFGTAADKVDDIETSEEAHDTDDVGPQEVITEGPNKAAN